MTGHDRELRDLVARQLGLHDVGLDDRLVEDLGAESIDVVTIVAVVEESYRVSVDEERLPRLRTVRDLAEEVARLQGGG
jgi:acyl carrier protein